jgi:NAD(P)-dependent dehydrogenase (short-subunit alcohol dehydrogenase family)
MPQNTFKDSVVLITGASSGIGREMARQLARQGARLVLAARRETELTAVAEECRALGPQDLQVLVVPTDVSEPAQCEALVRQTVDRFGRIDMLVNNAGVTMWARFDEVKELSIFDKIIRTNYLGSVYCTYFALPYLKQTRGRIVAVSSLAGKNGVPTRSGYAASKHAMAGFFDSLRIELAGSGVSVTVIYPGFVATGVQARAFDVTGKPLGKNPVQVAKVMQTDECAAIILRAAARRQREEVMELRGKLGLWIKLVFPGLVDRIAARAIQTGR